jgi:hypothetical protein
MSQIRKGFIAANAIDGSKLKLLNNEAIRAAQADGADVELMKLDGSNVLQFLKLPQVSADPSQGNDVARKSYVDAQVSAANSSTAAGLASEQAARESADSGLQSAINAEKGRIDAILSAATADADSFAEIVNLINSVDTENDSAFGSYVISNNAALAQESADRAAGDAGLSSDIADEASARQAADTALQGNLDQEVSDRQAAVSGEASARQSADAGLQSQIDALDSGSSAGLAQEVADRQAADSAEQAAREAADSAETAARQAADAAEQSAREAADSSLQANIDAEAGTRASADSALSGRVAVLEADPVTKTYVDTWGGDEANTRAAADANLQSQIDNLTSNLDPTALDSLTEIVGAFQAADSDLTAAVTALGTSASSAVAAEESRATAAEAALQAAISAEVSRAQGQEAAIDTRFTNNEAASAAEVSNRQAAVSAEEAARQAADSAETAARQAADTSLQGEVDAVESALAQEVSDRQAAVSAEQSARESADSAETSARQAADSAEQTAREAADSALDVRVDAIEAVTSRKEKFVLSSIDLMSGYVDLAVTCKADSELVFIGSLYAHDGDDYTVSTVNSKTRITFAGPLAAGGLSQLTEGDAVYVRYLSSETGSGGGGGGGGTPSSAGFMIANFGAAVGTVNWMSYGATTEQVRLEFDMAGFWLNIANLGPASSGFGYTPSFLNIGGTYRLVLTDVSGTTVVGNPSMSFTYQGAGPGPGPGPVTYSFPMVIGQTDNGDGTTTFDWTGANLPMMQEVRLVKVVGPGMYDTFSGINLGVLTPTSSGVISSSSVNNYDSYALQTFMGPTSTATSASFQIPSGTGI